MYYIFKNFGMPGYGVCHEDDKAGKDIVAGPYTSLVMAYGALAQFNK